MQRVLRQPVRRTDIKLLPSCIYFPRWLLSEPCCSPLREVDFDSIRFLKASASTHSTTSGSVYPLLLYVLSSTEYWFSVLSNCSFVESDLKQYVSPCFVFLNLPWTGIKLF